MLTLLLSFAKNYTGQCALLDQNQIMIKVYAGTDAGRAVPLSFLVSVGSTEALEVAKLCICSLPFHVLPLLFAQLL